MLKGWIEKKFGDNVENIKHFHTDLNKILRDNKLPVEKSEAQTVKGLIAVIDKQLRSISKSGTAQKELKGSHKLTFKVEGQEITNIEEGEGAPEGLYGMVHSALSAASAAFNAPISPKKTKEPKHTDPEAKGDVKVDDVKIDLVEGAPVVVDAPPASGAVAPKVPKPKKEKISASKTKEILEHAGTSTGNTRKIKDELMKHVDDKDVVEIIDRVDRSTRNKERPNILKTHETKHTAIKENKTKITSALNKPDKFDAAFNKKISSFTKDISSKMDNIYKKKKFYE